MSRGGHLLQILRLQLPRAPGMSRHIEFPSIGLGSSSCVNFVCVHHRLAILHRLSLYRNCTQNTYMSFYWWYFWLQMHLEIFGHSRDNLVTWRTPIAEFEIFHYLLMRLSIYKARVTVSLHSCPSHVLLVQSDLYPSSYTRAVGSRLSLGSSPFRG